MSYCRLIAEDRFDNRIFATGGVGRFPYVPTVPAHGDDEIVVASEYTWLEKGKTATGVYDVIKRKPRPKPVPKNLRYYSVDMLSAIGDVVGAERYDGIKAALSANRIGGVPVWDMLISGMFIPDDDQRLQMIRNALVEDELVTDDEFDKILELAASDEPVPESGAEG